MPWSVARSINVTPWSAKPADLWPTGGTVGVLPTLRWSPLPKATQYEIEVVDDPSDFGAPSQTCHTFANAASFAVAPGGACVALAGPGAGDVYWRVRGLQTGSPFVKGLWSDVGHFVFDPPAAGPALPRPGHRDADRPGGLCRPGHVPNTRPSSPSCPGSP